MMIFVHGIDIVEIGRIVNMLDRHGGQFPQRCFTASERAYSDDGSKRRAERYAARFACKEAVFKALGTGWRSGMSWQEVEVIRDPSGQPQLKLCGRCAEIAAGLGIRRWLVSLSHSVTSAIASVIGVG